MKNIPLVLSVVLFLSCDEIKESDIKRFDFVVTEKIELQNDLGGTDYFLKSKDTIIRCGTVDYAEFDVGDTIKLATPTKGFFRGTLMKSKK